jgi:predicted rRNA methylase YqxC with S4 and FtsJ domains
MDSSDASNVYITGLDEATTYTFFGWAKKIRRDQRKFDRCQCNHRTEYSDSPDISLNDVSFTSMTVHMETVYAADKNVTVSMFPGFRWCHG